jgi:hypothetical protein
MSARTRLCPRGRMGSSTQGERGVGGRARDREVKRTRLCLRDRVVASARTCLYHCRRMGASARTGLRLRGCQRFIPM